MEELFGRLPGRELPVDDHLSRCSTAGCRYYGLIEFSGRCYECHRKQSTIPVAPGSRGLITG